MSKTISYTVFVICGLAVVLLFVTSKSYTQLGLAAALYIPLVYMAFRIFPRSLNNETETVNQNAQETIRPQLEKGKVEVDDVNKRVFLKLIGAAGLSFFIFSLFKRKTANLPLIGKVGGSETTMLEDVKGNKIDPAQTHPTDGYRISEVDDNAITFYGFIKKGGSWFIMKEDTETGSFRYVRGDADFSNNWGNRENLSYDYYSNVF